MQKTKTGAEDIVVAIRSVYESSEFADA